MGAPFFSYPGRTAEDTPEVMPGPAGMELGAAVDAVLEVYPLLAELKSEQRVKEHERQLAAVSGSAPSQKAVSAPSKVRVAAEAIESVHAVLPSAVSAEYTCWPLDWYRLERCRLAVYC